MKSFKVSEVNEYIKKILTMDIILNNLQVEGEISNFKLHSSGHMYFSLKDNKSRIRCIMFRSYVEELKFLPKEGSKVIIKGYVSLYDKDGQYQLYVQHMQPSGIGELYLAYEQLKERLEKEGLFSIHKKKPLPYLPQKIGVVTSSTGAAIKDIISVITRRNSKVEIILYPVLVQGLEAASQIAKAIDYFNKENKVDVIIVGRGGGSIEELWAFNEEIVARSISNSTIPIISAVGHETDFTISDFVADIRAATPSAAGELVMPSFIDLQYNLKTINQGLIRGMKLILNQKKQKLENIQNNNVFKKPYDRINQYRQQLDWFHSNLVKDINKRYEIQRERFLANTRHLHSISPLAVLQRGYGILKSSKGNFIMKFEEVEKGENVDLIMHEGTLKCEIKEVLKGEKNLGKQ